MKLHIRQIQESDYPLLEDFLYHAIYSPPGTDALSRDVIFHPSVFIYIKNFGRPNDCGMIAELNGKIIGAAWTRIIPAYGHIDDATPELAIAVLPDQRGHGAGTALLVGLFEMLRERGYKQTSLSVQKANPAARLYQRLGYEIIRENDEDYLMIKDLQAPLTRAAESDMAEILTLQYAAYQSEALIHNDFTIQPLTQTLQEALAEYSKSLVLKSLWDGKIIGSVRAYEKDNTIYIGKLMVHPNHQGRGLGKRLLAAIEQEFPHKRYELFTSCKSERNLRLYEQAGYRRFREESDGGGIGFAYLEKDCRKDLMIDFLRETPYIDFSAKSIQTKARELFGNVFDDIKKARLAYEFVRDQILHSFDINATTITAKASDVLRYQTGICHAKANLLAALLRSQGIPTGFCFQHITLAEDDSAGYCVHCFNAVWLNGHWVKLDARGNTNGINAQFSLNEPVLAYPCRPQYHEYCWPGIYADPHIATMLVLDRAKTLQDVWANIPDTLTDQPDVQE